MSIKCLICYCHCANHKNVEDKPSKKSLISKHLNVIFILRNIFQVPVSQLANYLKNCAKVDNWIGICDKCQDIVKGYRIIYDDLLEISRKFQEAKLGIVKIVKTSYKDDGPGRMVVPDITDECRRFINNYEYENPHNPFKDGDLKALHLTNAIHHGDGIWTSDPYELIGHDIPDSPTCDIEHENNEHDISSYDDDLVEPEELQKEQIKKSVTTRGRGRPPKKPVTFRGRGRPKKQKISPKEATDDGHLVEPEEFKEEQTKKLKINGPDSTPADFNLKDEDNGDENISSGKHGDDLLETEEPQQGHKEKPVTTRGRGRPPKNPKISSKELMDETDGGHPVEPKEAQNKKRTIRGRGRPLGSKVPKIKRPLKEFVDEWKPGFVPKKKWKLKKKKKPAQQKDLKYPCPHSPSCTRKFSSKIVLDSHLRAAHGLVKRVGRPNGAKKYPLEFYSESGSRKQRFRVCIPSKCESCNKSFKNQDCLRTHIKFTHDNRFPYYCKLCGIGRTSKPMLEKHEAICSKKAEVSTPTVPETESCPEEGCTLVVSRITGLEIHFREKHPQREPFSVCPHCEQKLYTKRGYARHLKSEHQISKPFTCEHCGGEFKTQGSLRIHKKVSLRCKLLYQSEAEAKIICDICGGKFSNEHSLQRHIEAIHEDNFKLRCEHCGKGYTKDEYLKVHLFKRHQIGDGSDLKYKCRVEGCSKIFYQPKVLESHMALHEGRPPKLTCEECGKGFHGRGGLYQHKRLMHGNKLNEKKFKCDVVTERGICGAEFGVIDYLTRHKRVVHKIFPEKRRQDL